LYNKDEKGKQSYNNLPALMRQAKKSDENKEEIKNGRKYLPKERV